MMVSIFSRFHVKSKSQVRVHCQWTWSSSILYPSLSFLSTFGSCRGSSGWNSLDFFNDGNYTEDHTPRPLQRASDRATAQCADERTRKINSFLYLSPCTIILVRILPSSAARSYTSLPRMCCTITKCAITLARCVDCSSSLTERDKKKGGFIFKMGTQVVKECFFRKHFIKYILWNRKKICPL